MWDCQIQLLWKDVVNPILCVEATEVPLETKLCILGICPHHFAPTHKAAMVINLFLLQARRVIVLRQKSKDSPTPAMWITEMTFCLTLEKLTYVVRGKPNRFKEMWDTFQQFLESDQTEFND